MSKNLPNKKGMGHIKYTWLNSFYNWRQFHKVGVLTSMRARVIASTRTDIVSILTSAQIRQLYEIASSIALLCTQNCVSAVHKGQVSPPKCFLLAQSFDTPEEPGSTFVFKYRDARRQSFGKIAYLDIKSLSL